MIIYNIQKNHMWLDYVNDVANNNINDLSYINTKRNTKGPGVSQTLKKYSEKVKNLDGKAKWIHIQNKYLDVSTSDEPEEKESSDELRRNQVMNQGENQVMNQAMNQGGNQVFRNSDDSDNSKTNNQDETVKDNDNSREKMHQNTLTGSCPGFKSNE